jgi:putative radical SAM enzyme (TIGR03279 family)
MREAIYLKDEDYRLSFLYGNYVTLTSANRADLERIVEQRLSPLYVSIHATDAAVRKELLGLKLDDYLLEKLRFLFDYGIEVHGQVVICPGINDGHVLDETIETLQAFYPDLRSLSIVPVGLTQHRQGLRDLKPVDANIAVRIIQQVAGLQEAWTDEHGEGFVYLADEFYLLTGKDVPPLSHYGDFWQLDNGVGMMRYFLSEFDTAEEIFPDITSHPKRVTMATGMLAAPVLQECVAPRLNAIDGLCVDIQAVPNRFYGDSVTVSGLLTGRDIIEAFEHDMDDSVILLPPNCVNSDGLMLDDATPDGLAQTLGRPVRILDDFEELWDNL